MTTAPVPSNHDTNNDIADPPAKPPTPTPKTKDTNNNNNNESEDYQREFEDEPAVVDQKVTKFVEHIQQSQYAVVYTGAGVSTNTQRLPDFRGDQGLTRDEYRPPMVVMGMAETKMDSIMPTFTHYCLRLLMDAHLIHKIITSNHDGLHDKSGIQPEEQIEIFGNVFAEKCRKCKTRYYRHTVVSHLQRKCDAYPKCKGKLKRTACNMGEKVDKRMLARAQSAAEQSDFALVLGSSMTVYPFCELPMLATGVGFVLVTRQETTYDEQCLVAIHTNVDNFMFKVMQQLFALNLLPALKQNPSILSTFKYQQAFDCIFQMDDANEDMLKIGLQSRYVNEGLPFIASASLQILLDHRIQSTANNNHSNNVDENENGNAIESETADSNVMKEFEFQQKQNLNWTLTVMKSQFLASNMNVSELGSIGLQVCIQWEKGFNLPMFKRIWSEFDWGFGNNSSAQMQVLECQLTKSVVYDVPSLVQ